jgi:hypothetical protein
VSAIAALMCAVLACLPAVANASILGISLPASATSNSPSLISIGGSSTVSVELPTLGKVEVDVPVVQLPPVAKVEVTPAPKVEVTPVAKVEVAPVTKVETTTPVQTEVSSGSSGGESTSSGSSGTGETSKSGAPSPGKSNTTLAPSTRAQAAPSSASGVTGSATSKSPASATTRTSARSRGSNEQGRGDKQRSASVRAASSRAVAAAHTSGAANAASRTRRAVPARVAAARASNPLEAIGKHVPLPLPVPNWSKPIILLLLLLALWFGVRARVAAARARRLEGQRTALLQDLGVMQATLVPVIPGRVGALNVSVAYRPADGPAAGGDFYDVFELEHGKVALILGDVAGHGHSALEQAALTRYTLRAYIQAGMSPRAALALAGGVLADPEATHFATVAVGVYDSSDGTLTYASAGHPAPISLGFDAPEPLTICCSPPVGWDVPTGRRQSTVSLPAEAVVCFFSDGLIEARAGDGLLGRDGLAELLAELGERPSASALLDRVSATARATPDDMVSCIVVPDAGATGEGGHVEELEVDAAALEHQPVEQFLAACGVPAAGCATAIARARELAGETGTALLRVDRQPAGRAGTVTVLAGLQIAADVALAAPDMPALGGHVVARAVDADRARGLQPTR